MALIGDQRPRLESIPISFNTAAGEDAIALAETARLYLDDWQQYVLVNALARGKDGLWTAFEVLLIVSRQNGKGAIYEARELFGLFAFPSDRLIIHTAHEHKTASEHYLRIWNMVETTPELMRQVGRHSSAYGREFIETKPKPTIILGAGSNLIRRKGRKRLIFIARTGHSGRGFTGDLVCYDEAMILEATKIGASLPSLSARPNPQVIYAGSAGLEHSTQMAKVRRRGISGNSEALLFTEWSADICDDYCEFDCTKHDDPESEESIARANPAYGIRITPRYIRVEREAFKGNELEYYRERLGVGTYPADAEGWAVIPEKWWLATKDNTKEPERIIRPIFAVDIARDRSTAAIAVAGLRASDNRIGIQIVDFKAGTGWLLSRIKEIHAKWKPMHWVIDRRASAGSLITEMEKLKIPVVEMQATDVSRASGLMFDAFRDDTIRHYGQAALRTSLAGAEWRKLGESMAFDRINAGSCQMPLMAGTFAHWGSLEYGDDADYNAQESVYFSLNRVIQLFKAGHYGPEDIRRLHDRGVITTDQLKELAEHGINI